MNFIPSIFLSSILLLTLTACNSGNDAPKSKDTQMQTSSAENTTAQTDEALPEDEFRTTMVEYDPDDPAFEAVEQAPQEEFELSVRRDPSQHTMTGYVDKLMIVSLNNDPTTLTGVSINRGNCGTKGFYDYKNMRYGSVAQVYLGCAAEYVREVTISTNSGLTYTYNFQSLKPMTIDSVYLFKGIVIPFFFFYSTKVMSKGPFKKI